jgi:multicomponent K+:H+ antiporter subunit E
MIQRFIPHPVLTVALLFFWLTINKFSLGHLVLGTGVSLFAGWSLAALRPPKAKIGSWLAVVKLTGIVLYDIILSNIAVARVILFQQQHERTSTFLTVPLDMKDPMGLAILATVLTATPGSAWLEYNSSQGTLLIHVLENESQSDWVGTIKNRYEKLLMEIFE